MIFRWGVSAWHYAGDREPHFGTLVSQVCHQWREVALGDPLVLPVPEALPSTS
ncbi:hypothetical protein NEOLEDRAFT_1134477 [Neolentinus lepideus HHB14362 ss-1]|uniref:Uncharacterized protein n=1 Tax=Neolentinus lepideus HHB14362 ss-1 TaxID=1314782 RepID=A0A165S8R3_9AGAM|nr:hypothetical protein NEOLEDRAFT_1134477 [Neolentinus lepideus HHB14362 ss-1]